MVAEAPAVGRSAAPPAAQPLTPSSTYASVWLWQLPSATFSVVCALAVMALRNDRSTLLGESVAIVSVLLATLVAARVARSDHATTAELSVPLLLLLAAAFVHGSAGGTAMATIFAGGLPVAWLAFTFGVRGLVLGVVGIGVVAVAPFVAGAEWPVSNVDRLDALLPALALVGMAGVTYGASRILTGARAQLAAHADALAFEASTNRTVLNSVNAAVSVFAPDRAPVCNQAALETFEKGGLRLPWEPGLPMTPGDRVFGEDRETPIPADLQAPIRATRGEDFDAVLHWIGHRGEQAAMVCSAHAIFDDSGDELGTLFVAWDATELLDSMRIREEFLATVSHELRTPLTSIIGYLEIYDEVMEEGGTAEDASQHLDVVRRNARALHDRIGQLLSVARTPEPSPRHDTDVATLFRAKVAEHQMAAHRAGLDLRIQAPSSLMARVDPMAMEQILDNLLTNAVKYTHEGSVSVVVAPTSTGPNDATTPADEVSGFVLTVTDTGVGMDEKERRHAFERFYRAEGAVRGVVPGLGIGLAITKRLVIEHHGSIRIESRPDEGTTFVVKLPSDDAGS